MVIRVIVCIFGLILMLIVLVCLILYLKMVLVMSGMWIICLMC